MSDHTNGLLPRTCSIDQETSMTLDGKFRVGSSCRSFSVLHGQGDTKPRGQRQNGFQIYFNPRG